MRIASEHFLSLLPAVALCLSAVQGAAGAVCDADLDDDDLISFSDVLIVLSNWGECPDPPAECPADLDGNGDVGFGDLLEVLSAWGKDCALPEVVITPIAHQWESAPGIPIPGAVFDFILTPTIDAAGNVAFLSFLTGGGIDESTNMAIFHGQPGAIQKLVWESDPAPGMGGEIILKSLLLSSVAMSETGWIAFTGGIAGPGIIEGVNDRVTFAGPPGDIRPVMQGGEQPPGVEEGTVIDVATPSGFGTFLSDHATLLVVADLTGPAVDEGNDRAFWIGTRDELELVWREGMPAPVPEPDVVFDWAASIVFNDNGDATFRAGLRGLGIVDSNDRGRAARWEGELMFASREGDQVPGFPPGVTYRAAATTGSSINNASGIMERAFIQGPGISEMNEKVILAGPPTRLQLVARQGDAAPEAGSGVEVDALSGGLINDQGELIYQVKYRGPSIDDSNRWAVYYGPVAEPHLALRDGEQAPQFPPGTVLARVVAMMSLTAMNDNGMVLGVTEIAGPGVTPETNVVLWARDPVSGEWFPLLRGGDEVAGRTLSIPSTGDLSGAYEQHTGGSDGMIQSLNDSNDLVLKLEFTDGSHGVYHVQLQRQ